MARSNRVRWSEVDQDTYEDMVAVLISRLHPTAQRIDGSGGDGGRDVLVPLEDGLEIYQLKSHTGRVRGSRRTHVKNSLARAAEHEPAAWHLVVPIDPTPGEDEWFKSLTSDYPFACRWLGKTWLDSHMADMPEIRRYYLEDARDEILELIERVNLETSALQDGVPGAIERLRALQTEVNQIDPHYLFYLSSQPDASVAISVHTRYPGAEKDRPIHVRPQFVFPDTPDGQQALQDLQRSLEFGTTSTIPSEFVHQVSIDLPAGLGGEYSGAHLTLGSSTDHESRELLVVLQIRDHDSSIVAQLPLNLIDQSSGHRGAILTFTDTSKAVTAAIQLDSEASRLDLNYEFHQPNEYNPATLLPAVLLIASLEQGNQMTIVIDGQILGSGVPQFSPTLVQQARGFAHFLEALTFLQLSTGVYFDIQRDLTDDEIKGIYTGVRLLRGEVLQGTWTSCNIDIDREGYAMLQSAGFGGPHPFRVVRYMSVVVHDFQIPIGHVVYEMPSSAVSTPELDLTQEPADFVGVTFVPAEDNTMSWWLLTSESDEAV